VGGAETISKGRRPASLTKNWVKAVDENPGVSEGDMSIRNSQGKHGTTCWSPRPPRWGTARAARISRWAVKSRCAGEWGAWGRLSDDGPGQHNPDRSEGPWGKAAMGRLNGGVLLAHRAPRLRTRIRRCW
jgi:hypothetical protein